jgi:hypothetical protein
MSSFYFGGITEIHIRFCKQKDHTPVKANRFSETLAHNTHNKHRVMLKKIEILVHKYIYRKRFL